jgi:hypothetical protein
MRRFLRFLREAAENFLSTEYPDIDFCLEDDRCRGCHDFDSCAENKEIIGHHILTGKEVPKL